MCWAGRVTPPSHPHLYRLSPRGQYLFGRRLGESNQGEVRYAIRRSDGESVAVKCVKRNRHSAKEVRYLYLFVPKLLLLLLY